MPDLPCLHLTLLKTCSPFLRVLYDRSTQFWSLLLSVLNCLPHQPGNGRDLRKGLFWAAHQRFYKGLLIAAKVCLLSVCFFKGLLIAAKVCLLSVCFFKGLLIAAKVCLLSVCFFKGLLIAAKVCLLSVWG
jgi:hypothetical protein